MSMRVQGNTRQGSDYFALRGVSPPQDRRGYLPPSMIPLLPGSRDASILDIGCGFGDMLLALSHAGYRSLKGVDISPQAVEFCRQSGLDVDLIGDLIDFCQGVGRTFDFIIMSHVLEHIEKSRIIDTLAAVHSLLSTDGLLFLKVPNAQSNTGCYWRYEDFTHTTLFTSGSIRFVLEAAGFGEIRLVDIDGTAGNPLPVMILRRVLLAVYRLNLRFWNRVTRSAFHDASPQVFTYDLTVVAR